MKSLYTIWTYTLERKKMVLFFFYLAFFPFFFYFIFPSLTPPCILWTTDLCLSCISISVPLFPCTAVCLHYFPLINIPTICCIPFPPLFFFYAIIKTWNTVFIYLLYFNQASFFFSLYTIVLPLYFLCFVLLSDLSTTVTIEASADIDGGYLHFYHMCLSITLYCHFLVFNIYFYHSTLFRIVPPLLARKIPDIDIHSFYFDYVCLLLSLLPFPIFIFISITRPHFTLPTTANTENNSDINMHFVYRGWSCTSFYWSLFYPRFLFFFIDRSSLHPF